MGHIFRTVYCQIEVFTEQVYVADIPGIYTDIFSRKFEMWVDSRAQKTGYGCR